MERYSEKDSIDRNILQILSSHTQLTPLQLWYELGEDDAAKGRLKEEEIVSRLEVLRDRGFVELVTRRENSGRLRIPCYCLKPGALGGLTHGRG